MDDDCNQGKDDYSDIQDRALSTRCVRYLMPKWTVYVRSRCTDHYNIIFLLEYSWVYSRSWIQRVFYNGCSRVLEKFVRISGVHAHMDIRCSKQLILTEELFTEGIELPLDRRVQNIHTFKLYRISAVTFLRSMFAKKNMECLNLSWICFV